MRKSKFGHIMIYRFDVRLGWVLNSYLWARCTSGLQSKSYYLRFPRKLVNPTIVSHSKLYHPGREVIYRMSVVSLHKGEALQGGRRYRCWQPGHSSEQQGGVLATSSTEHQDSKGDLGDNTIVVEQPTYCMGRDKGEQIALPSCYVYVLFLVLKFCRKILKPEFYFK